MAEIKKGAISLIVTLVLLFSGFFTYQWFFIEKSIREIVERDPFVQLKHLEVNPQAVTIKIRIPNKSLFHYPKFYQSIQNEIEGKEMKMELEDHPNANLLEAWNEVVFGVEEGISQKRYTLIQKSVKEIAEKRRIGYEILMDDSLLCITLKQGEHYLYRVLDLKEKKGRKALG